MFIVHNWIYDICFKTPVVKVPDSAQTDKYLLCVTVGDKNNILTLKLLNSCSVHGQSSMWDYHPHH